MGSCLFGFITHLLFFFYNTCILNYQMNIDNCMLACSFTLKLLKKKIFFLFFFYLSYIKLYTGLSMKLLISDCLKCGRQSRFWFYVFKIFDFDIPKKSVSFFVFKRFVGVVFSGNKIKIHIKL